MENEHRSMLGKDIAIIEIGKIAVHNSRGYWGVAG